MSPIGPSPPNFSLGPDVSFRGEAEVGRAAESAASVESDPEAVICGVAEIYPVAGAVKPRKVFRTAAMPSGVTVIPM